MTDSGYGNKIFRHRALVTCTIKPCISCKKLEGSPFNLIYSKDLPTFHVDDSPQYFHAGIDFIDPILVSGKQGNMKSYISPFMCATLLAVHLVLVKSLEVVAFIRAFRSYFCARRGPSGTLLSDSAKTCRSASKHIKKLLKSLRLEEHFNSQG